MTISKTVESLWQILVNEDRKATLIKGKLWSSECNFCAVVDRFYTNQLL